MTLRRKASLLALFFFTLTSTFAHAQLSKNSPFLEKKNHIMAVKAKNVENLLILIDKECAHSRQSLPQWMQRKVSESSLRMRAEVIKIPRDHFSEKELTLYLDDSCVLGVGEDHPAYSTGLKHSQPNDPLFSQQVFLEHSHFLDYFRVQTSPSFQTTEPAIVAVVDSGISLSHPDFLGRHWRGPQGEVGYNFISKNFDVEDDSGHGSHVAGLIGAIPNNGIGVLGVGVHVKLMTLKALDKEGVGSSGDVANAIRYAADHGADLINLSLSIGADNPFIRDAIDYALEQGVFIVAATGNDGLEITPTQFFSPAGLAPTRPGLVSVGSVDSESKKLSYFSNHSSHYVELAAPGSHGMSQILSTYKDGRYFGLAGTSMAAPQVSGAMAQLLAFFKSNQIPYTPQSLEASLLKSSRKNENLLSFIKNGAELDLRSLSHFMLKQAPLISSGGLHD